ncbi:MAG: hypothetical protein JO157_11295 [Acetobacteraceae bacterium]|nr:hypothetical protein [Acetobacteraceae bacterium]
MPFQLNQDRRHIPRQRHRVTNWREYDASLRQRGSLTVWFTDEAIRAWTAEPRTTRGGQPWYTAVIVPPRLSAVPSATAQSAPTQRDRHLRCIAEQGRMAWQKASSYTTRARVEATIGRFKQVIGDGLRSRTDERRATEVAVAVHALNRMLDLGRPTYVRIV